MPMHRPAPEADHLAPDTLIQTLLRLLVRPDLTTEERQALSQAIAALHPGAASSTKGAPRTPFLKYG